MIKIRMVVASEAQPTITLCNRSTGGEGEGGRRLGHAVDGVRGRAPRGLCAPGTQGKPQFYFTCVHSVNFFSVAEGIGTLVKRRKLVCMCIFEGVLDQ